MGRLHELDERGEHEGYVVGYVPRDWTPTAAATAIGSSRPVAVLEPYRPNLALRELGILNVDHEHEVHGVYVVGYACACGWRSPYRELGKPFEWSPSVIHWTEWTEDLLAKKWWVPHVEAEVRRGTQPTRAGDTAGGEQSVMPLREGEPQNERWDRIRLLLRDSGGKPVQQYGGAKSPLDGGTQILCPRCRAEDALQHEEVERAAVVADGYAWALGRCEVALDDVRRYTLELCARHKDGTPVSGKGTRRV